MRIPDLPAVLVCRSYGNSFSGLHRKRQTQRRTGRLRGRGTEKDRDRNRNKDRQTGRERERESRKVAPNDHWGIHEI